MQLPSLHKKAQAGNAVSNLILLIIGVGVSVMVLIFVGTLGGSTYELSEDKINAIGNNVVKLESFNSGVNGSVVSLGHSFIQEGTLSITNTSTGLKVALTGNFTVDYDAGTVQLISGAIYGLNKSAMTANYTWGASEVRGYVQGSILSGFSALETTGSYLPIIVLAVVIALVLSLVLGFTAFGNRGGPGNAL